MQRPNYPITILQDLRPIKAAEPTVEYFDIETGEFQKIRLIERKIKYGRAHPRAWTFGAVQTATPSRKVQICPESEKAALAVLEGTKAKTFKGKCGKANEGRKLSREEFDAWMKENGFVEPVITPIKLKSAFQHWPKVVGTEWKYGVCLHFPTWLAQSKDQDAICQRLKETKRYLNGLDRQVFGSAAYRKHETRIPRCVVEEWEDSVGFHIHMLMILPPDIDPLTFIPLMKRDWHLQWWDRTNAAFRMHSFWAEEIIGGHKLYISKHIGLGNKALFYGDCTHFP